MGSGLGQLGQVTLISDSLRASPWAASQSTACPCCCAPGPQTSAHCPGVSGLQSPPRSGPWLYLATPGHLQAQGPCVANASFIEDNKCISINVLYHALSKASCLLSCLHLLHSEAPSATNSPDGRLPKLRPPHPALCSGICAPLLADPSTPLGCSLSQMVRLHLWSGPSPGRVTTPLPNGALVSCPVLLAKAYAISHPFRALWSPWKQSPCAA